MNGQFVAAAGTYLVMSKLAQQEIHASCTFGNAPNIDILISSSSGEKSLALQVKTARHAGRTTGRGEDKKCTWYSFTLGHKAAKFNNPNILFAFVDLDDDWDQVPIVYIIPSAFIYESCKDWVDNVRWARFEVKIEDLEPFKENWDLIRNLLA